MRTVFISPLRLRCLFRCFHICSATIFSSVFCSAFWKGCPRTARDRKFRHVVVLRWGGYSSFQFSSFFFSSSLFCLTWLFKHSSLLDCFRYSALSMDLPIPVPEVFVKGKHAERVGDLRVLTRKNTSKWWVCFFSKIEWWKKKGCEVVFFSDGSRFDVGFVVVCLVMFICCWCRKRCQGGGKAVEQRTHPRGAMDGRREPWKSPCRPWFRWDVPSQ